MKVKTMLLVMTIMLNFAMVTNGYADKELDLQRNVRLDKIWTIIFNKDVDVDSINKDTIYILDNFQNKILLDYNVDGKKVELICNGGYEHNSEYTIHITDQVKSGNKNLKEKVIKPFKTRKIDDTEYTGAKYFEFNKDTGTITKYSTDGPKDIVIPIEIEGVDVISIGDYAFNQSDLTSVIIPEGIETIGDYAFGLNNLTSLIIPEGVETLGNYAFENNSLISVILPKSIKSIGEDAFYNNNLTQVNIPEGVKSVANWVFHSNKLTSIIIPKSVTRIGNNAFSTNNITSLVIPQGVTKIDGFAFNNNMLTSVSIPNSVVSIGENAFTLNKLTSVTIPTNTVIHSKAFDKRVKIIRN